MYFDRTSYVISIVQAVSYITKDWLNMIGHWQRSLPNFRGLYSIKMNQYIFPSQTQDRIEYDLSLA